MAAFLGGVVGRRGEATRLGSKRSGIHVRVQDWNHRLDVSLTVGRDGATHARLVVRALPEGGTRVLYDGPLERLWTVPLVAP